MITAMASWMACGLQWQQAADSRPWSSHGRQQRQVWSLYWLTRLRAQQRLHLDHLGLLHHKSVLSCCRVKGPQHRLLPNAPFQCASRFSCTQQEAEVCCVGHGSCRVPFCWSALCWCRPATLACCMLMDESQIAALRALTSSR